MDVRNAYDTFLGREQGIVRDLAKAVVDAAHAPEQEAIRRRWRDVNSLRKPDRAPVWCRPVGAWQELLPESALECTDPWLRSLEREFRQILIKKDIGDDTPIYDHVSVQAIVRSEPPNLWGIETKRQQPAETTGAWAYDPPLRSPADLPRLVMPRFHPDSAETQRLVDRTVDLLGDIMDVKVEWAAPLDATLGSPAADLLGLEGLMLNMTIVPEFVHRVMVHIRDAVLTGMDAVENTGWVTPNNEGPMILSDPIGPSPAPGRGYTFANCWCMANSQEFDQVSPAMWEEFCLAYQRPILARYGAVAYGCCENLTKKIEGVLSIPNLRIFVCSAWTDLKTVLDKVPPSYCIMWRQKASDVVFARDDDTLRRGLREGCRLLRGRSYQIVLRELQTLNGRLDRLHVWTRIAKQVAEEFA
ncbi:MAG: hypothetical protein N2255_03460 [Kiritimatiellae bacterium]|nr:hypothetical protein [Kiritimatiellia bacterium]